MVSQEGHRNHQKASYEGNPLIGNPPSLSKESLYLQGARDVLLRLKDDYDMYLVPCAKFPCKPKCLLEGESGVHAEYNWFPINDRTLRKMLGDAMIRCLTMDRESLVKYLQGDSEIVVIGQENDKKGKITHITIKIE